jgi:hypothetical protein
MLHLCLLVHWLALEGVVIRLETRHVGQAVEAPHLLSAAAEQLDAHIFGPLVQVGEHEA